MRRKCDICCYRESNGEKKYTIASYSDSTKKWYLKENLASDDEVWYEEIREYSTMRREEKWNGSDLYEISKWKPLEENYKCSILYLYYENEENIWLSKEEEENIITL